MMELNDDNFEEILNTIANGGKAKYTLTPMGSMYIALSSTGAKISLYELRKAWRIWEQQARTRYGRGSDVAAVVFDKSGGSFHEIDTSL